MPRVILKYRSIAHGNMKSIYLEFNPPVHDVKGKSVRYECLNLEIYTNPETCQQLKQNMAVEEVAETIRCERYLQLVRNDYSFLAKARLDEDFLEYFRQNGDCHGIKYQGSRLHFERFCKGQCKFKDINASLCERFRLYLLRAKGLHHTKCNLSRNSASSYFNAFLSIVHFAYKDNILSEDYAAMVEKIKWNHDIPKEYLSSAEIKQLASTLYDENPDVYRAEMFSIYTGLRRGDILALRWENIHYDRGRRAYLRFRIRKTGTQIQLPLSLPAIRVLGAPKSEGKVFPMITESILTVHVRRWITKARIRKHITFHCFRHTFAMQLLEKGVDIYTIAALLGHRQVSSTQNYAKITPKKVLEAILKIG